jgi:hypothetical protein
MSLIVFDPYWPYYYYVYPPLIPIPIPVAPVWYPLCPLCRKPLVWVLPIGRWYCDRCKAYF